MTKYEWESELKKNIYRLPKSEQDKVVEYYNELFQDKMELGRTESQAIMEFGNPMDVAYKILSEYASENPGFSPNMKQVETSVATPIYSSSLQGIREEPAISQPVATQVPYSPSAEKTQSCGNKNTGKTIAFIALVVILGGVAIGLTIGLWSLLVGMYVFAIGFIGSGIGAIVGSFISIADGMAVFLAALGTGILTLGIGLIVAGFIKIATIGAIKASKGIYHLFFGWYFKKKEETLS